MVKIFASELSKCRKLKALFGWIAFFLGFIVFIVFPLMWFFKAPIEKTSKDFVKEYVLYRMNFTPDTARDAFYNKLQYIHPLYQDIIEDEIRFITEHNIYQYFVLEKVISDYNTKIFRVRGNLIKFSCSLNQCKKIYDSKVSLFIREIKGKYTIEEVR